MKYQTLCHLYQILTQKGSIYQTKYKIRLLWVKNPLPPFCIGIEIGVNAHVPSNSSELISP